jgi:hypothetical protein
MKIIKYLGYLYTQYSLKKALKGRSKGDKGILCSEAAEFRKYYIK